MIRICLFGGQGGQLPTDRRIYFTMFGTTELRWPTVARQISDMRQAGTGARQRPPHVFVTIFGGTVIKAPTLANEYLELQSALRSGRLTLDDWDRALGTLDNQSRGPSLTLFGGFDDAEVPGEDEELEGLALNRHLGYLSPEASDILLGAVGQRGSSRAAAVRQALATAMAHAG
jgi:hypothetical protein